MNKSWPTDFDFETDEICQSVFKPFILEQIAKLEVYDELRPEGHVYRFHAHSERVAQNVRKSCLYMGLGNATAQNMYWAVLPHDIGKMALPVEIWDVEGKPDGELKAYRRTHTRTGVDIVTRALGHVKHPFKDLMVDIMLNHHEKMDGTGQNSLAGRDLSLPVRLTCIADSFDGWRVRRPHFEESRDSSVPGVLTRLREEKGAAFFDMDLVELFEKMKMTEYKSAS